MARAERATLDSAKDLITLTTAARVWDPTGISTADRIVMRPEDGRLHAEGHVASNTGTGQEGPVLGDALPR